MPYELAKQLKDAGFPQKDGTHIFRDEIVRARWAPALNSAYIPTLEELIEACGNGSFILGIERKQGANNYSDWSAQIYTTTNRTIGTGSTPSIAVASLYLALHPHSS